MTTSTRPALSENLSSLDNEGSPFTGEAPLAVVIGCGDLGMACARLVGRRHPLMLVDIAADKLEAAVEALRREGYTASAHVCDIANPEQVELLGKTLAAGPGVHSLIHVAAIANTPGGWRAVMNVDLVGVILVARAIEPSLVRNGVAVLISSTGAYHCPRNADIEALIDDPFVEGFEDKLVQAYGREPDFREAYFIAKQGVNRLAERLAIEWGPLGVRAVSVSPGLINSTMGRTDGALMPVWDGGESRMVPRAEKARIENPLRRQASLLEIAAVVDFLASDAASFVSGIDVPVDGGANAFWRTRNVIER